MKRLAPARLACALVAALGLPATAFGQAGLPATETSSGAAEARLPEVDERLRAEEAWATREFERRQAAKDGGVTTPIPPPGQERPKLEVPGFVWAGLGVLAGLAWGTRYKQKKRRLKKPPRD